MTDPPSEARSAPNLFEEMNAQIGVLSSLVEQMSSIPHVKQAAAEIKVGIDSLKLAMFYLGEAGRCISVQAYFSAAVAGAAALESMLLAKCAMSKEQVINLPGFMRLPRSATRDYAVFLCSQDLGKLLAIAEKLGWLSVIGVPVIFERLLLDLLEPSAADGMKELILRMGNIGEQAAKYGKLYRDRLHPAKCVREGVDPEQDLGLAGVAFIMLAFSALVESSQNSRAAVLHGSSYPSSR